MFMDFLKGINAVSGIIPVPAYNTVYDLNSLSMVRKPVDHYARLESGDPKNNRRKYSPPVIPKVGSLIGAHKIPVPTYSGIVEQNQIHDPDNYDIIHRIEITPEMNVYLNDINIGGAPEYKQLVTGKTKKLTQPERLRFCKGICWFLMNDQICLKDKLKEIGYCTPAVSDEVISVDHIIEHLTGTDYPGSGAIENYPVNFDIERENIESMLYEELTELSTYTPDEITGDDHESDNGLLEWYWPDVMKEAFKDGLAYKYYPHLKVSICEVTA
jgi:hypothetical protein